MLELNSSGLIQYYIMYKIWELQNLKWYLDMAEFLEHTKIALMYPLKLKIPEIDHAVQSSVVT